MLLCCNGKATLHQNHYLNRISCSAVVLQRLVLNLH